MPKCYDCQLVLSSIRSLVTHSNRVHQSEDSGVYRCGENNCFRSFSCQSSFQKHLKTHEFQSPDTVTGSHYSLLSNSSKNMDNIVDINETHLHDKVNQKNIDSPILKNLKLEFNKYRAKLLESTELFVAKLYNNNQLPRSQIQTFINDLRSLFSDGLMCNLKKFVVQAMLATNCDSNIIDYCKTMFECLEDPFVNLNTDYKRMKAFESCNDYIKPEPYIMGQLFVSKKNKGTFEIKNTNVCGQFISLKNSLQRFFRLPYALRDTLSYISSFRSTDSCIENFVQSALWQRKKSRYPSDDLVLPIFIYYDDVNVNKDLSPHSGKIGAVYASLPCLPPECRSLLKNIFTVLLFETKYRETFGNERAFFPLLNELLELERDGVLIESTEGPRKVYFVTGLILGDNLGLNTILGLVESFSAHSYCRFCKMMKKNCQINVRESPDLLRNKSNYAQDLVTGMPSKTGIKEQCIFHKLPSFHMTENFAVDEMHDLREGIFHFVMIDIIRSLTHGPLKQFDLDTLNFRIAMFDYQFEGHNKPNCIPLDFHKRNKLPTTAAETECLVRHFGIIIGDLVPRGNAFWNLYLSLKEIAEVVFAFKLPKNIGPYLKVLIEEHLSMYTKLTGKNIKPKSHFITHYPRVFEEVGPLAHLTTIRFESKHTVLTQAAVTTKSRVNPTYTLAVRSQLESCYRYRCGDSILPKTILGPGRESILDQSLLYHKVIPSNLINKNAFMPNWIEYKGTVYKNKMILVVNAIDLCPEFAELRTIIIHEAEQPLFICTKLINIGLNDHIMAYEVEKSDELIFISPADLLDPFPLSLYTIADGGRYVMTRNFT